MCDNYNIYNRSQLLTLPRLFKLFFLGSRLWENELNELNFGIQVSQTHLAYTSWVSWWKANSISPVHTSVGAVPETSVPIRFRVLQFEDRFDSGSYLTSRPRFRVGSGRVIGSSICIWDNTIFTIFGGFFGYEYFKVNWSSKKTLLRCSRASSIVKVEKKWWVHCKFY